MFLFLEKNLTLRAICGKDISLEHARIDEYGRKVHLSCHAQQLEVLRRTKQA
jgi:hypothetical protein